MSANVFRAYQTGVDTAASACAPAPSGGAYFGVSGSVYAVVCRTDAAGTLVWEKKFTPDATTYTAVPLIASNSTHLAIGILIDETSPYSTVVGLYAADGTEVWKVSLPLYGARIAIGSDNSIFVSGTTVDVANVLAKLNASTGAIDWSVRLDETTYTDSGSFSWGDDATREGSLCLLSGGDVIICMLGPVHSGAYGYIQRVSGSSGSITWTKGLSWPGGYSYAAAGADSSDNIYVVGKPFTSGGVDALTVLKLDSSGNTIWNRAATCPSGFLSHAFKLFGATAITVNSSGVLIPINPDVDGVGGGIVAGHLFMPAAGTIATGGAMLSMYTMQSATAQTESLPYTHAMPGVASKIVMMAPDKVGAGNQFRAIITSDELSTSDAVFGPYTRTSYAYDVVSGSGIVSSNTWTRAGSVSFATNSHTTTVASATDISIEAYATLSTCTASSLGPTAHVGTPATIVGRATDFLVTNFGLPTAARVSQASSLGPTSHAGTPVLDLDKVEAATSLAPATAFGEALSVRAPMPAPTGHASSDVPSTALGVAVASASFAGTASGTATTAFGATVAQTVGRATSASPTTSFGEAVAARRCAAAGFKATLFGTTSSSLPVAPVGFNRTRFGTPLSGAHHAGSVTGFSTTTFGSVDGSTTALRTRSAYFRTRFGQAQTARHQP